MRRRLPLNNYELDSLCESLKFLIQNSKLNSVKTEKEIEAEKDAIKAEVQKMIKDNPESFPFIAQFWDIHVEELDKPEPKYLEFGKYNSKLINSYPFYKPFSKIIDLHKIKDEE